MLFKLALRNILRQKIRTGITLAAIVFGVVSLILSGGFVRDIYVQLGEAIIHSQTGHVQVFRKDFLASGTRQPDQFLIDHPQELRERILALPDVAGVSARLSFSGLLNNSRRDLAIVGEGIEPDKEMLTSGYLQLTSGRHLTASDRFGMMVGQGVASSLSLITGDQVTLVMNTAEGALNTLDFEIVGVFESFSKDYDARAVRVPLKAAQELLMSEGANLLVTTLHETRNTEDTIASVRALLDSDRLEASSWRDLSDFYDKTVELYDRQFGVLQLIILFMVILSVANSVNMTIFERNSEFGTMQALGSKAGNVFRLVLLENALLGLFGAVCGLALGIAAALAISAIGIPMPPPPNANVGYTAMIRLVPSVMVSACLIGFFATVLASLLPARRVGKIAIVDLLRQGA